MGCVTSQATNDKRRNTESLTALRDSKGHPLPDGEVARRNDEKYIEKKLSREIEQTTRKNEELNKEVARLKRQNEIKKKESMDSVQSKQRQMKRLESEKNRQIQQLRKELEREKGKSKENKEKSSQALSNGKEKQQQAVGLTSLDKHKALCQQCFYKLPRYTETDPSMTECFSCRGYGLVQERFPYGANPSCEKALCFSKGWDKVKSLRLCSVCQGRGGHQQKAFLGRRF